MQKSLRLVSAAAHHAKRIGKVLPVAYGNLRGQSSGDDAMAFGSQFLIVADGVGQWHRKPFGNPGLWSRLFVHHFQSELEMSRDMKLRNVPQEILQLAYVKTKEEAIRHEAKGTTTVVAAILENRKLHVLNVGDSRCYVIRDGLLIFRSKDQWHWFDCPFQLDTNSLDMPTTHASLDVLSIEADDVVVMCSDGLSDNLFDAEILQICMEMLQKQVTHLQQAADELVRRAYEIAYDPYAESPYLEKCLLEFDTIRRGGKSDDISVIVAMIQPLP